jgi:hypothetical protein
MEAHSTCPASETRCLARALKVATLPLGLKPQDIHDHRTLSGTVLFRGRGTHHIWRQTVSGVARVNGKREAVHASGVITS